jgi:D-hydroxyproline dehydrogenase subunit beta
MYDVAIVGAGIVGASCALACARRGMSVAVFDRGGLVAGTTGSGEGNILLSDKRPGPELDLALLSNRLWQELAAELGGEYGDFELEEKGGLVVAESDQALRGLSDLAEAQARAGVDVVRVEGSALFDHEPHIADDLAGGFSYPQDLQVHPAKAAGVLLAAAQAAGVHLSLREPVLRVERAADGPVEGVRTARGRIAARQVVNAAGAWADELLDSARPEPGQAHSGSRPLRLPVSPRRGYILVTEPVGVLVRHKVYTAEYLDNVESSDASLQASTVVEGTPAGTILIGATRELAGFDRSIELGALRRLGAGAVRLFPILGAVNVIRAYRGFRPYSADHLPLIGLDPDIPGLVHAHGHQGAGIGLAPATGRLVAELLSGETPAIDPAPFDPARFATGGAEHASA